MQEYILLSADGWQIPVQYSFKHDCHGEITDEKQKAKCTLVLLSVLTTISIIETAWKTVLV